MISIREIIDMALKNNPSDIHISPFIPPVCRCNGRLIYLQLPEITPEDTISFSKEILGDERFQGLEEKGECDVSCDLGARMRVNIYRERGRYCIAMRVLKRMSTSFSDLGLPENVFEGLCKLNQGLVLVTGPTGTGKTTTISAMINWINQNQSRHIITIEDPIEYFHYHGRSIIHQRETGSDTQNFHTALRSAMRQDPDIIFIGEMRDLESISTALTAAETGHLVFSTLHTIGAAKTIDRIVDVFPSHQQSQMRSQLSMVLKGIVSQQLVTSASGKGVEVALEILIPNLAISNLIRESNIAQILNYILTGASLGMCVMEGSLAKLVCRGKITKEDGFTYSPNKNLFKQLLEKEMRG